MRDPERATASGVWLWLAGSVTKAAGQLMGFVQVGSYSSVSLLSKHIDFPALGNSGGESKDFPST